MMMKRGLLLLAGAAALASVPVVRAVSTSSPGSSYQLTKQFPLGGDGGWDYINCDGAAHRLYISRGTHVMVVDTEKGAVVGDIPNTNGVHGIALDLKLGRGFTSNGRDNSVTAFDLKTLKVLDTIPVGNGPDCILFDPATNRVFTCNGGGKDATAIDAKTLKVVGTVPLDGRPEFGGADGRGHVLINIEDKSEVAHLDSRVLKVLDNWSLVPGDGPSGIAIDSAHHRLFSTCHNNMMVVMDTDTGKVVATPAIGNGPDAGGFDPGTGLAFSSNGEGTLTVVKEVDPDHFEVQANVPTQPGARTMTIDLKTHTVYLVTAKSDPTPPPPGENRRFRRFLPGSFTLLAVTPSST